MSRHAVITVSIVNDYPVVVFGISQMLGADPRFKIIDVAAGVVPPQPVDVVLFDVFGKLGPAAALSHLVADPRYRRVLIYSADIEAQQVQTFLDMGAAGYVPKTLGTAELADAIIRVHDGETVLKTAEEASAMVGGDWPGRDAGLSARESEMIALITQGATNQDIAGSCFLSINSVKSYIRSAYRKIGVTRRSQAVLWGVEHGMLPTVAEFELQRPGALE